MSEPKSSVNMIKTEHMVSILVKRDQGRYVSIEMSWFEYDLLKALIRSEGDLTMTPEEAAEHRIALLLAAD